MKNRTASTRVKWLSFGLLLTLVLIIVFQNLAKTEVHLLFATMVMPLAALLAATLLIGFLFGVFASALWKMRRWRSQPRSPDRSPAGRD